MNPFSKVSASGGPRAHQWPFGWRKSLMWKGTGTLNFNSALGPQGSSGRWCGHYGQELSVEIVPHQDEQWAPQGGFPGPQMLCGRWQLFATNSPPQHGLPWPLVFLTLELMHPCLFRKYFPCHIFFPQDHKLCQMLSSELASYQIIQVLPHKTRCQCPLLSDNVPAWANPSENEVFRKGTAYGQIGLVERRLAVPSHPSSQP